jgi:hypothetical protein
MLKALSVILRVSLLLAFVDGSLAQSQKPLPPGSAGAQSKRQPTQAQENPAPYQRGTPEAPVVVKVSPGPEDENKAAEDARDRKEKAELDRKLVDFNGDLAFYTEWLAYVAAFQFIVLLIQAYWLRRTVKVSEMAANAAKESADAVVSQLRAYISCEVILKRGQHPFVALITLENFGQTPAFGFRMQTVARTFDPGHERNFTFPDTPITISQTDIPPRVRIQNTLELQPFPPQQELVVFGQASYRDAFRKNRTLHFCFIAGGDRGFSDDGRMLVCPEGNYETED